MQTHESRIKHFHKPDITDPNRSPDVLKQQISPSLSQWCPKLSTPLQLAQLQFFSISWVFWKCKKEYIGTLFNHYFITVQTKLLLYDRGNLCRWITLCKCSLTGNPIKRTHRQVPLSNALAYFHSLWMIFFFFLHIMNVMLAQTRLSSSRRLNQCRNWHLLNSKRSPGFFLCFLYYLHLLCLKECVFIWAHANPHTHTRTHTPHILTKHKRMLSLHTNTHTLSHLKHTLSHNTQVCTLTHRVKGTQHQLTHAC